MTTHTHQTDRSMAQLVSDLSEQTTRLVRLEAALAAREVATKAKRGAVGGGMLAGALVLAGYAGAVLLAALVLGLATAMPAWTAALVVGIGVLVPAGVLALVGRTQLRRALPPIPDATLARVREDIDVIKEGASNDPDQG
jgi:putative superfamily III holin-X